MARESSFDSQSRVPAYGLRNTCSHSRKGRPLTGALPVSGEGRDSNPRRRETGVTTFWEKAAALGHSATSPIFRIRYSPECVEGEFCELRVDGVLGS
jgi:hypothetical protein